jgi:hypothetical protein
MSLEMVMQRLMRLARSLAGGVVAAGVLAVAAPCAAQDVDPPTPPGGGDGRDGLVAPSAWVMVTTPVQNRVDLKVSGFYVGELDAPVAQIDVPIRVTRFLTVTPSYMRYSVPARGLNRLPPQPGRFTSSYDEDQFRVDATVAFALGKFELSARNMYVRRFRPDPADDMNRYRGRLAVARPLAIGGHQVKPFASYETFYDRIGGWNRDRVWSGVTVPVHRRVFVQPSYMWEKSDGARDLHYVLLGLLINTR